MTDIPWVKSPTFICGLRININISKSTYVANKWRRNLIVSKYTKRLYNCTSFLTFRLANTRNIRTHSFI